MERTISTECSKKIGEQVLIQGWLHNVRTLGKINFVILRDIGGLVQIVVQDQKELTKLSNLQEGTVLEITGKVKDTEATELGIEIVEPKIKILVPIKEIPPVAYNKKSVDVNIDTELDFRPIVLRNPKKAAIFKVQGGILRSFAESMRNQGFIEFRSPVLMGAPSESGADVFEVKYFEGKAYLAQSPQIYKQIMVGIFERVFTIATVFRAEKHNTSRHLMEITQMDGEMGFIKTYDEILDVVEKVVRDILGYLEKNYKKELDIWQATLPKLPKGKFPRIKIKEALKIIEQRTGKSSKRDELDVDPEDEREIAKWALEKYDSDFLWLLNFKKNKNFYTWNNPDDPNESLSFDLECRGLEWLSGTHRINLYKELYKRFKEQGLNEEDYLHYLQAFKYGMPSEGGFSFGLERMTQQIFELRNIREATLFPSDLKRIAGARRKSEKIYGGDETVELIKKLLDSRAIKYKFLKHKPVQTSEEVAKVRNAKIEECVKAIILSTKKSKTNYMVVIPANLKVDMKKVGEYLGESVDFEKPESIKEKFGLELGGIPPFGNLFELRVLFDKNITKNELVAFNCGKTDCSIIMKSKDLVEVVEGEEGEWGK